MSMVLRCGVLGRRLCTKPAAGRINVQSSPPIFRVQVKSAGPHNNSSKAEQDIHASKGFNCVRYGAIDGMLVSHIHFLGNDLGCGKI